MKQKLLLFAALTFLTFLMLTRVVRAQTARMPGAPIKGVIVRGNKTTITYASDATLENAMFPTCLGVHLLVIEKGEYPVDHSTGDARVILHLHEQQIIHRDLAARNFTFQ